MGTGGVLYKDRQRVQFEGNVFDNKSVACFSPQKEIQKQHRALEDLEDVITKLRRV